MFVDINSIFWILPYPEPQSLPIRTRALWQRHVQYPNSLMTPRRSCTPPANILRQPPVPLSIQNLKTLPSALWQSNKRVPPSLCSKNIWRSTTPRRREGRQKQPLPAMRKSGNPASRGTKKPPKPKESNLPMNPEHRLPRKQMVRKYQDKGYSRTQWLRWLVILGRRRTWPQKKNKPQGQRIRARTHPSYRDERKLEQKTVQDGSPCQVFRR